MSWMDELRNLKALQQEGLLSQDEFEVEKARLLARKGESEKSTSNPNITHPQQLGSYLLHEELGRGGMGTVYRATHRSSAMSQKQGGSVAIKILHTQYAQDPQFQQRISIYVPTPRWK